MLRDTNVTLRCKAEVRTSGKEVLTREFTIYKDNIFIHNKTSVSSDDLLYPLPHARVSNSGTYQCTVKIKDKLEKSEAKTLTVRGGWSWRFTPTNLLTLTFSADLSVLVFTLLWALCRAVHTGAARGRGRGRDHCRPGDHCLVFCSWRDRNHHLLLLRQLHQSDEEGWELHPAGGQVSSQQSRPPPDPLQIQSRCRRIADV